jgi:membrane-associated protease RseP (regulator of RpoE activity)
MQEAFLRVQLLWEENMAEQIVNYLDSPRGEGKTMVVFTGIAHVKYGFGVPKKVVRRLPATYHIILPAIISAPAESADDQQLYMDVELPDIPLLSGDFIWAVPYESLGGRVLMGIRLNFEGGTGAIEKVSEDSAAEEAGLRSGDILVKLDGHVIQTMEDVSLIMGSKAVGDSIDIKVLRDGVEMAFTAYFRKTAEHPG